MNKRPRQLADGLWARPFTHADEDNALAERQDVAALQCRQAKIAFRIAPPNLEILILESGMKLIDSSGEECLLAPRRPMHGIERDTAVDPGTGVACEHEVWQRRRHKSMGSEILPEHAAGFEGQVADGNSAGEDLGNLVRRKPAEPVLDFVQHAHADVVLGVFPVKNPRQCRGVGRDVRQKLVHVQNLDAALLHLGREIVMIVPGFVHPEDIVEEKVAAIRRGQPFMRPARTAREHCS